MNMTSPEREHSSEGYHHDSADNDSGSNPPSNGQTKRRKKASRACYNCQKAHVTCEDTRPCSRCIKRGLVYSCTDGLRKKAKYLAETVDSYVPPFTTHENQNYFEGANDATLPNQVSTEPISTDVLLSNYDFGSKTANLEYSIISNMLGSNTTGTPNNASDVEHDDGQLFSSQLVQDSSWGIRNITPKSISTPSPPAPSPKAAAHVEPSQLAIASNSKRRTRESIYSGVTQPFPYTAGFHALIAYFKSRFSKDKLLQLARAMAWYRPSFIAVTKGLTEDDLIFMEKCFQRTLLEYERFIAASGTPTIIWRRTGQIAAVGKEFCILTGWSRERLLGQRTFMVELMDDESAIDYVWTFSKVAFADSRKGALSRCNLLLKHGGIVPCGFAWTIKRDVFDIPMIIIGNVSLYE